jgi:hypothetical protein
VDAVSSGREEYKPNPSKSTFPGMGRENARERKKKRRNVISENAKRRRKKQNNLNLDEPGGT